MDEFFEEEKQWDIMKLQKKKLLRIFKLNPSKHSGNEVINKFDKQFIWKVIIYDSYAKNIVESLLKMDSVRTHNVTMFLDLDSKRDEIHNAAAIYLIKPCKDSIEHIIDDLNGKLYDNIFINFISPCSDEHLEYLATSCSEINEQDRILQVYNHYLNYFSVTSKMFTLNLPDAYTSFYRCYELGEMINEYLNSVAEGIFMFLKTNSLYPYIRFYKNDIISLKIAKLLRKLYEKTTREEDEIPNLTSTNRPLLILLNRSIDLYTMLHHPWKYISLLHDIFGINNGKIEVSLDKNKKTTYEIDYLSDTFLQKFELADYPDAASEISSEFDKWNNEFKKMSGKGQETDISAKLNEAIGQLPEMIERKNKLEAHTNLTTLLYDHIKKRGYDQLNDIELQILSAKTVSSTVMFVFYSSFGVNFYHYLVQNQWPRKNLKHLRPNQFLKNLQNKQKRILY